ncbi:uracil-DNA glycosylase [Hylemonella gracilis]|uniref:Uracil-DNA glycosylase n=1 Tax=Hylemonella gracilis TaxID=80880 RepID=A0A4P6UJE3_9BURK|nr:uracil-DNA glycosylase [Hylemonella gracilis]QBK04195.1 uracil-DNA glycosylase [Hylemonella gracilis]
MSDRDGSSGPQGLFETERLRDWTPSDWLAPLASDERALAQAFFDGETGQSLARALRARLDAGAVIYPPRPLRALELTPLKAVRVLILGQDPYHGPGQAEGLAFSVAPGVKPPPSLRNIYKELARDPKLVPWEIPAQGSLQSWARQGVLLLNTCLTVEEGQPASHANLGWEVLTRQIVRAVAECESPVVFLLWGAHAQKTLTQALAQNGSQAEATGKRHRILTANHPSPLSALRGPQPFLGCGHFSLANDFLRACGRGAVVW